MNKREANDYWNVGDKQEIGGGQRKMVQNHRCKDKKINIQKAKVFDIQIPARI